MTPSHPLDAGRARSRAAAGLLSVLTVLSVGLVGFTGSAMAAGHAGETRCRQPQWIGAYAAAMAVPSTSVNFGFETKAFADQTLRMIVSPHVPGAKLRLRFTNQFGKQAVTFDGVHVGLQHADGPDVVPGSNRPVTFSGGGNAVSIPAGGAATSDPLEFRVEPFRHLAVSFHVVGGPVALDMHPEANQRSFRTPEASGDHAGDESGGAFTESSTAAYALEQIEVLNAGPVTTVVTLGDSITDGAGSTHGADRRYPDILQRRLLAAGRSISVLNVGIGGNQITRSSALAGPSGVERFTHDVAERPGVTDVIVMEGHNDIGASAASSDEIIAALEDVATQAHAAGLRATVGTLIPFKGFAYYTELGEQTRIEINDWIRSQNVFDHVVDFDRVLADPNDPQSQRPEYRVDGIHPNDAGYAAMAAAIDVSTLTTARCSSNAASSGASTGPHRAAAAPDLARGEAAARLPATGPVPLASAVALLCCAVALTVRHRATQLECASH